MKSLQFRSIAPKAPAVVPSPSPAVVSCQPTSALPDATTASSPKSIIVPTQNYALMQIAGQDGTFSLVALPPSVSSQSPQQQQTQSIQKNLKLPIPRYQSVKSKGTTGKVKSPPLLATTMKTAPKAAVTLQTKPAMSDRSTKKKKQDSKHTAKEPPVAKEEPSEQLLLIDPASSDISVTALLPDNAVLYPSSQSEQPPDGSERPAAAGLIQNLQYPPAAIKSTQGQSLESKTTVRLCQSKPSVAQPQSSITVLSPAIFSKAVQIIPSPPKGKLPILPYSKMKNTLIPAAKSNPLSPEKKSFCSQTGINSSLDTKSKTLETTDDLSSQVPTSTVQPQTKTTLMSITGSLQKPPGKKRGRKRKTMEDVLAFEARKKRSLSFFRRRTPEKSTVVVPGSKQKEVDISKKYRSIRPKPMLVMETVPQLVSLPAISPDGQEQELVLSHQLPSTTTSKEGLGCGATQPGPVTFHLRGASHPRVFVGSRPLHRCPTCSRCFQFKHHLQSHMNSHTNSRPYVCPVCRKAYAHSGSLSTHMKLHHSEVRPRRSLSCEFCEKAFGYVGVYFSHLKEVHKVVLTVEPSISHHEEDIEGMDSPEPFDEQDREDPVELQIKCGRCQVITPTFADMKMHLLYVHEEEIQVRPNDGQQVQGGRGAENELVKYAAHYRRQLGEKRNLVKCGSCDEEFFSFSKLKRHILSHHRGREWGDSGAVSSPDSAGEHGVLSAGAAFNCVLCSQVLNSKEGVMEHWTSHHHCEQPSLLWEALSSYSGQEECEVDRDLDTPAPSPH